MDYGNIQIRFKYPLHTLLTKAITLTEFIRSDCITKAASSNKTFGV